MKAIGLVVVWLLLAAQAGAAGFSRVMDIGVSGVVEVAFGGQNIWKPLCVAVVFQDAGQRTLSLSRHVEGISYQIASVSGDGTSYVYVFEGAFWFSGTNVLRIAVSPAGPGKVEVIGE